MCALERLAWELSGVQRGVGVMECYGGFAPDAHQNPFWQTQIPPTHSPWPRQSLKQRDFIVQMTSLLSPSHMHLGGSEISRVDEFPPTRRAAD